MPDTVYVAHKDGKRALFGRRWIVARKGDPERKAVTGKGYDALSSALGVQQHLDRVTGRQFVVVPWFRPLHRR
jgi:hypothetical protein